MIIIIALILGLLILLSVGIKLFPEYTTEIGLIVIGIELLYVGLYFMIKNEVKFIVRKYKTELQEKTLKELRNE